MVLDTSLARGICGIYRFIPLMNNVLDCHQRLPYTWITTEVYPYIYNLSNETSVNSTLLWDVLCVCNCPVSRVVSLLNMSSFIQQYIIYSAISKRPSPMVGRSDYLFTGCICLFWCFSPAYCFHSCAKVKYATIYSFYTCRFFPNVYRLHSCAKVVVWFIHIGWCTSCVSVEQDRIHI